MIIVKRRLQFDVYRLRIGGSFRGDSGWFITIQGSEAATSLLGRFEIRRWAQPGELLREKIRFSS